MAEMTMSNPLPDLDNASVGKRSCLKTFFCRNRSFYFEGGITMFTDELQQEAAPIIDAIYHDPLLKVSSTGIFRRMRFVII